MTELAALRKNLTRLTFIYGYQSGSFTLSSGRKSSYYIDGKQVTMSPEGLYETARFIISSLADRGIKAEAVGGLTLGADSIAAGVCVLSHLDPGTNALSSFIVRKEAKKHGTQSRIEGPFYRNLQAVIVDDVLTTGASVLSAAAAVVEAGGRVATVFVLVDRMEGGYENVAAAGFPLEAILNRADLEALQRQLEEYYPSLTAALQEEAADWTELPWKELSNRRPRLAAALEEYAVSLFREFPRGTTDQAETKAAAQRLLKVIKAAEFHPAGEEEALRLLAKIQ
ncbi:MAG: orotate phosphoribosyltransferase [Bacillota bacterium]